MFYFRLFLCLVLIAVTSQTHAAKSAEDVIYLIGGSVVRGQIIEQAPGEFVRVQTIGGSEFVFKATEVEAINKESRTTVAKKKTRIAAVMSFLIPGSGQFYTGDHALGATYLSSFVVGVAILYTGYEDNISMGDRGNLDVEKDDWKICMGSQLYAIVAVESARNAYRSAKKYNERNNLRARLRFTPMVPSKKGVGAMLSYSF